MRVTCAPSTFDFSSIPSDLDVVLYSRAKDLHSGSIGSSLDNELLRQDLAPATRAWDLLSIALAVLAADISGHRSRSPDGWTREVDLTVSVIDPAFWAENATVLSHLLEYLTTDRWTVRFEGNGAPPPATPKAEHPEEDCVVLLSGGLDSFVGAIGLVSGGKAPMAVSQTVRGDAKKQRFLASQVGTGLRHFRANHNASIPDPEAPLSQRARSMLFLSYGVLLATTLAAYRDGVEVPLYVCENGFIAVNPPLTSGRLGSLSTRSTHPFVLRQFQDLLNAAGLRVRLENPYQFTTKGEMLRGCPNQTLLEATAFQTTSCGRFQRHGYKQCGRCVPCLVRRAAIHSWKGFDRTEYVYSDLSRDDERYAGFDDVRSALIGVSECRSLGVGRWLGATLSACDAAEKERLRGVVARGLSELEVFLEELGVR